MNIKSSLLPVLAVAGMFLSVGCASFDTRTDEKSYVFNGLPAETKQRLKDGEIHIGDTTDMVYIALGDPSEKRELVTREGKKTTWIYASYHREYEGEAFTGYQRVVTRHGLVGGYRVTYVPVSEAVYSDHVDERFRVTFNDGFVTEIDSSS